MTFYVDNETEYQFPFQEEEAAKTAVAKVLSYFNVVFGAEINLVITDSEGIREYNNEFRGIDKETDVLSFPGIDYNVPCDFSLALEDRNSYFNPETEELLLGDIILNKDRILSQAEEFGHSILREYTFLIVHSMLHLLGFDHMVPDDEKIMFAHQDKIMGELNILR